jgi:acyl-coenzyme A synthetase/AMP-(fatty) acid ligase
LVLHREVHDEQLIEWLRQRVEEYKIPRIWQRVEKIAKTDSGKIQRHLMQGAKCTGGLESRVEEAADARQRYCK